MKKRASVFNIPIENGDTVFPADSPVQNCPYREMILNYSLRVDGQILPVIQPFCSTTNGYMIYQKSLDGIISEMQGFFSSSIYSEKDPNIEVLDPIEMLTVQKKICDLCNTNQQKFLKAFPEGIFFTSPKKNT